MATSHRSGPIRQFAGPPQTNRGRGPIGWLRRQWGKAWEEAERQSIWARVATFFMFLAILAIGGVLCGSVMLNIYLLKGGHWPPW